ncbi:PREDICTED: speedy protein C, partial [Corvus brachyrhynchos]|uniref:speedy protein C n=1 Tax=Corvus brachyrhynchos TaxID=85066 RepID=UPI0008167CB1
YRLHLHRHERDAFFSLLEDTVVQAFLSTDVCCRVSDKYLLAMALTYFKRAGLPTSEYTPLNLFAALYLASDMEEDEEEPKLLLLAGGCGGGAGAGSSSCRGCCGAGTGSGPA